MNRAMLMVFTIVVCIVCVCLTSFVIGTIAKNECMRARILAPITAHHPC